MRVRKKNQPEITPKFRIVLGKPAAEGSPYGNVTFHFNLVSLVNLQANWIGINIHS